MSFDSNVLVVHNQIEPASTSHSSDFSCIFCAGKAVSALLAAFVWRMAHGRYPMSSVCKSFVDFGGVNFLGGPSFRNQVRNRSVIRCKTQMTESIVPHKRFQEAPKSLPSRKMISKMQNNLPSDSDLLKFEEVFIEIRSPLQFGIDMNNSHKRMQASVPSITQTSKFCVGRTHKCDGSLSFDLRHSPCAD